MIDSNVTLKYPCQTLVGKKLCIFSVVYHKTFKVEVNRIYWLALILKAGGYQWSQNGLIALLHLFSLLFLVIELDSGTLGICSITNEERLRKQFKIWLLKEKLLGSA